MEKIVIGVIGRSGSGKATLASEILSLAQRDGIAARDMSFSDLLSETLGQYGIEANRSNLQQFAIFLHEIRPDALSFRTRQYIEDSGVEVFVIDGLRREQDYELLRTFKNNVLVALKAEPRIRFERLTQRQVDQKPGEAEMTWHEFQELEQVATEVQIDDISTRADYAIFNNSTPEDLKTQTEIFWKELMMKERAM